jgi:Uma2 family endonuclease
MALANAVHGSGAEMVAVGAIQRGKHTQLQPDILIYPSAFPPTSHWRDLRGWWLAVEVLSPSSRLYDREVKRGAYLALGVEEYWIVNPDDCSVEVWSGVRSGGAIVRDTLVRRPTSLDRDIVIDLGEVFDGVGDGADSPG